MPQPQIDMNLYDALILLISKLRNESFQKFQFYPLCFFHGTQILFLNIEFCFYAKCVSLMHSKETIYTHLSFNDYIKISFFFQNLNYENMIKCICKVVLCVCVWSTYHNEIYFILLTMWPYKFFKKKWKGINIINCITSISIILLNGNYFLDLIQGIFLNYYKCTL